MLASRPSAIGPSGWRSTSGGAIAAIVVIALAVSGCSGGSGKSVAVSPTTTSTAAPAGARGGQAFIACMKSHGVTITSARGLRGGSTSTTLPPGVTSAQFQAAMQACRSLLPTGGGGNFLNNPAFAAYRNCLMLHGVTLPQPGSSTSSSVPGGGGQGLGGLDRSNPTVQAALTACAALRPAGGFGGSTTTTPAA